MKKRLIKVSWKDSRDDWPWFYLLKMKKNWLHLEGADYPDGSAKHEGDQFWVHHSEINFFEEVHHAR